MQEPVTLAIALAGLFKHSGSIEDLASRIGAISSTEQLPYWSTTRQEWRVLISEAFALQKADAGTARPDFTSDEILSGQTLYFAQNDTRSRGLNVYSIVATSTGPDHLSFYMVNLTPIRLPVVTLFERQTLQSLHLIERKDRDVWSYYGISTVKKGPVKRHENSFINRNAAFYRFLIGQPPDQHPPLAP